MPRVTRASPLPPNCHATTVCLATYTCWSSHPDATLPGQGTFFAAANPSFG